MQLRKLLVLFLVISTACNPPESNDEKAIKERTLAYEGAFNKNDSRALANLWAEEGFYTLPESGQTVEGRDAIRDKFDAFFKKRPKSTLAIAIDSITFPNPDEAIESATATISEKDVVRAQMTYKVIYEKIDGQWLISEIREILSAKPPKPSPHLKELEWLIGSWVDQDQDTTIDSNYQWDRYKVFITQHFSITAEGKFELEGKQIIGWDPINEKIRSWIFDSDGGFGEGNWRKDGSRWILEIASTLADGRKASAVYIFTPIDKDHYTIQSTDRSVGGELLPDIEPVTVVRKEAP